MSIARKTAALLAITLGLMVVAIYPISRVLVLASFARVEADDTREHVGLVQQAFGADEAALTTLAEDWSNWDDSYGFVEDTNQDFIAANIHGAAYQKLGVDAILFINVKGELVQSAAFDRHTGQSIPVPNGFVDHFSTDSPLLRSDEKPDPVTGVLSLADQQIVFTALPIYTSEYKGPAHGTLVFGRLLDAEVIGRISKTVHLDLQATRTSDGSLNSADQAALAGMRAGADAVVVPLSDQDVAGYGLVKDVYGKPAVLFQIRMPRTIYAQGQQTIQYFLGTLVLIGALVLAVTIVALRRIVLRRLQLLAGQVSAIGDSADLQQRVVEEGRDELAGFATVLNKTLDALQQAEQKLRASETRNRALVAAIPDAMVTVNRQGTVVDFKPATNGRLSTPYAAGAGSLADALPADAARSVAESAARAFETDQPQAAEFTCPSQVESGADEGATDDDYEARVVRSGSDEALAIIRDVTERKRLEEAHHNAMLLREIHHRVKNNLQVISSLLSLQAEKVDDPALTVMFRDSQNRVKTMALIHEKLYRSRDMDGINLGEYLRDLVAFLVNSYRLSSSETTITVDASDVELKIEKAVPCGLIVNELVTNALKYAFPDQRPGKIEVRLASDDGGKLELTISDDGVGLPASIDPEETQTLGLRLVRSLADQLDAGLEVKNGVGTAFKLTFAG